MSLQGPVVVVAEVADGALTDTLRARGVTQVEQSSWAYATDAIAKSWPAGVILNELAAPEHAAAIADIARMLATMQEPYLPVLARVAADCSPAIEGALPISQQAGPQRVALQLASALRVRTLHAAIFRRQAALQAEGRDVPAFPQSDPLQDAIVLCTGRGRSYPELCTAVGERVGLIGSLSVESAARYLNTRNLDGIIIGEGFGPATIDAFLTALGEDDRFRDLPIAQIGGSKPNVDVSPLPNYERFDASPTQVLDWMMPLIRLHAYEAQLQRQLAFIETDGLIDPHTGLFTVDAFANDLAHVFEDAKARRAPLSLAQFNLPVAAGERVCIDAARQINRFIRSVDFACRTPAGALMLALPETPLREAHIIVRRIANALHNSMLAPDSQGGKFIPGAALATLRPGDTVESLMARVSESAASPVAAE